MSCQDRLELEGLRSRPHTPVAPGREGWVAEALAIYWKEFNFVEQPCSEEALSTSAPAPCPTGTGPPFCTCLATLAQFLQQQGLLPPGPCVPQPEEKERPCEQYS